jgi:hypothetical protein
MKYPSHNTILFAFAIACLMARAPRADERPAAHQQTLEEIAAAEVAALKARIAARENAALAPKPQPIGQKPVDRDRTEAAIPKKETTKNLVAQRVFGGAGANAPASANNGKAQAAAKKPPPAVDFTRSFITLNLPAVVKAPVAPAPAVPAVNDAMVQQLVMQYQPLVTAELAFVRQICDDLSPEQRKKIKSATEASLKHAATQMAQFQQGGALVLQANGIRTIRAKREPEPAYIIRDGLGQALQDSLAAEQLDRYRGEAAKRLETRKRAAVASVVARLDAALYLTADQREAVTESISANWQSKWENWLLLSAYGGQYLPQFPEKCVSCLSDEQLAVWRGLQKIEVGMFNFNPGGVVPNDDGWWDGRKPGQKPPADAVRFINRLLQRAK